MLSATLVREVSRTSVPARVSGWTLDVENLVRRAGGSDWESGYYRLTRAAAKRIAREINQERPWVPVAPALPAASGIRSVAAATRKRGPKYDLEGELVKQD